MVTHESIRCPNCGSHARRRTLHLLAQSRTECDACDYLLVTCTRSHRVLESYAPGIASPRPRQPEECFIPLKQALGQSPSTIERTLLSTGQPRSSR